MKSTFALVVIEVVGLSVVRDEEIDAAVVIDVGPDSLQAEILLRIIDAGLLAYIGEGTVSVVVIEGVR